ncbi:orotidine-5'-phosphate decarboxylase [Alteromonas sp. a30]|uniref:orotidine-5'-phosphate decarboxylase n=1 Tax=Alteromonas sp. a30 TaxID=2730917 RepID=UPI0022810C71|nr:orotidine-5'-phosphate decarboxylase [Alteromonas sp. a30]MCY7294082.1 orotidine-5'-phosphate decarboxylase [Alteromonas sp. a30]
MNTEAKIIVALDYNEKVDALNFVSKLTPEMCKLKVGKEMFTHFGPDFVRSLVDRQFDVFLDLKFHDIPNTVAKACKAASDLGVWMVNVHASGGPKMMQAAREALESSSRSRPKLISVTMLTSMDAEQMRAVGFDLSPEQQVLKLAKLTQDCGLDGIVCSAQEAHAVKSLCGLDFCLVTPGIRPEGSQNDDQTRIMTPLDAVKAGSDYLVIGRPVTQSSDPVSTLADINQSLL